MKEDDKEQHSEWKTSYSLLDRIKDSKDHESWTEFINYYEQYIYNIVRFFRIPPSEADDICQDIIIILWEKMPDFVMDKKRGKFRHWLSQVIRHHICSYVRNIKNRNKLLDKNTEYIIDTMLETESSDSLNKIIDQEWKKHISNQAWLCIKERFNKNAQKVFLMAMDNKSTEEIAKECNISINTVYVYRNKIKTFMKEEIAHHNENFL